MTGGIVSPGDGCTVQRDLLESRGRMTGGEEGSFPLRMSNGEMCKMLTTPRAWD